MYNINIKNSLHSWEKKNLVTISGKKDKSYDEMECIKCGIKGRRYNFTEISVSENYNKEKVYLCPNASQIDIPKKVKVIECTAYGRKFANLIPDSEHIVIDSPTGEKNDHTGVWVMGKGEPVKLLTSEFKELK